MTKLKRTGDGGYLIKGKKYETLRGTRRQVYEYETAYKTAGGLLKGDLVQNDKGRIVSKAKFDDGPNLLKNLTKRGFFTKKGKFGHTKMKTRKLRKKLTRKNRRKMKGGATIQDLKEQLSKVKNIIPNKIEEIKKNSAYQGVVDLAGETGEEMFNKNLFTPLEELNKTFEEPINKIETNIDKLENEAKDNLENAKKGIEKEVKKLFEEIKEKFENIYDSAIETIKKGLGGSLSPAAIAFSTALNTIDIKGQLIGMITLKEKDILKQIDDLTLDDIAETAVKTAEKTIEKPTEEEPATEEEKPADKEEKPAEEGDVDKAVEEAKKELPIKEQEEIEEQLEAYKARLVKEKSSPAKAAEIAAEQINNMAEPTGGKKKSKGKK
jgi:hypothetical protein